MISTTSRKLKASARALTHQTLATRPGKRKKKDWRLRFEDGRNYSATSSEFSANPIYEQRFSPIEALVQASCGDSISLVQFPFLLHHLILYHSYRHYRFSTFPYLTSYLFALRHYCHYHHYHVLVIKDQSCLKHALNILHTFLQSVTQYTRAKHVLPLHANLPLHPLLPRT